MLGTICCNACIERESRWVVDRVADNTVDKMAYVIYPAVLGIAQCDM